MFRALRALLFLVLLLGSGCSRDGARDSGAVPSAAAVSQAAAEHETRALVAPYPYAAWRIGDRSELEHVVLWVSHILVRFEGAKTDEVNFNLASWSSVLPPPTRTRAQALLLAQDIADQARLGQRSFAELARDYSEDITTKERGGALGGVTASQLTPWPGVVDALAALRPGQSSLVVETWYGFHVFYRSPPPPEETVSGSHIVIAHDQAGWLQVLARSVVPRRSRAEAMSLANEVYDMARRSPERFEELVARYSEHRSALMGGDFGSYSTREPNWYPREVEVLSQLAVGEVAPPIDSPVGFEIIRRTANRPRRQYAMDSLWLAFDPSVPDAAANSRSSVLARATAFAERVAGDPERFAALQREVCCTYVQQWQEGRGTPALTALLEQLPLDRVASAPVQSEFQYVIAKRIAPTAVTLPTPRFELPVPERPDLGYHICDMQGSRAEAQLRLVAHKIQAKLGLSGPMSQQLLTLHELSGRLENGVAPVACATVLSSLLTGVQQLLNEQQYSDYLALLHDHFKHFLLDPANETAIARVLAD